MVKGEPRMSESGGQRYTTANKLAATKDKMKVHQRMIDLTAIQLESTRKAMTSDQDDRAVFDENVQLVENKLMKLFARQLMHKHQYLQSLSEDLDDIEKTFDSMISFDVFLSIANLSQKAVKALSSERLSVDTLFHMTQSDLFQLFNKHDITTVDSQKLMGLLDLLTHYYEKWERGEKPAIRDIRNESCSSRLNSVQSLASLDSRKDSYSSHTVSPPSNQSYSRSSTPITPVTPSSTQSPMLGLPHQNSTPVFPVTDGSPSFKRSNSSTNTSYQAVVMDQLSSSSSSLNSDIPHSYIHQVDNSPAPLPPPAPPITQSSVPCFSISSSPRKNRKRGHTRSHSNPPLANIIMPEVVPENSIPNYRSPSPLSPAPPTRAGSHPSIVQNMVMSSPSAKSHPQMRRLIGQNSKNTFNRSQSTDLGGEDCLQPLPEPPIRSNSEASSVQSSSPRQRKLSKESGTSTSMVDLPLIRCSTDQFDQSDYSFPRGGKSYSVPRLANLVVNGDSGANNPPNVPTSPRLLSNYNPTGVIGHKIDHRFDKHVFFGVHECDYCKKTLVMGGAKCRYCKYKCHKGCSKVAPPTCGLPQDFLNYARKNKHLLLNPHDGFNQQPHGGIKQRNFSSSGEYSVAVPTSPKTDDDTFLIPDLSREPANSQYSPVIHRNRPLPRGHSSTSRLEVPHKYHPSPLHTNRSHTHSTSSSPSTSTQSSPCNTPISPRSPIDGPPIDYSSYTSGYIPVSRVPVILTDEESLEEEIDDELAEDHLGELNSEDYYETYRYSEDGSINDISDQSRLGGAVSRGLRPPPQVISAQSLPNLLMADQTDGISSIEESSSGDMCTNSENNLENWIRKESLINTLSTADSKTSTLVESTLEEDDSSLGGSDFFSSQGELDFRPRIGHRNSTVDEWIIPYEDLKILEKIGSGPVANVYKGYWHGEVAIKRFYMPDATRDQVIRFREEIAVLKKTRHENLALFMGACVTPPNFAIITNFCKGYTLYKLIHHWSEVFSMEKLVNLGKQIALAMGYLHARGIIHKGLNTKNIFIEKTTDNRDKVVITDMGLSALSSCLWSSDPESILIFPRTQLYYLAPEIMRCISSYQDPEIWGEPFPFSEHSDIYSYGTILYEMMVRKFPFTCDALGFAYEYEAVIFMVGKGKRQEFKTTDVPKKLKELVWDCWDPVPERRPSFTDLKESLARLFRKHTPIIRSPSHPINLSKSVDNLLFI